MGLTLPTAHAVKYPELAFANDPQGHASPPQRASAKLLRVSGSPLQFVIGREGKVAAALGGECAQRLEQARAKRGVKVTEEH